MQVRTTHEWSGILRTISGAFVPDGRELQSMLEAHSARDLDEVWFLAWRVIGSGVTFRNLPEATGTQSRLWRACAEGKADVDGVLEELERGRAARGEADEGALLPQGLYRAIEVWTETELSSLHALWRVGVLRQRSDWRDRAVNAARWHISRLQPDNATNRPWAVHIFALIHIQEGCADAGLYAETLIHNCQVQNGHPDPLSALILLDAAEALEQASG